MTDQVQETQTAAAPATKQAIINGRMPVAIVALVRFGNNKGESTKAKATMFGTTVGKIDDIQKNRNFAYVTADFKPTAEMKAAGIEWLKKHPDYDKAGVDKLVLELESFPEASTEDAAAFEATRIAARGQTPVTKAGEPANAGGGNRRPKKGEKAATSEAPAAATGDALLA